MRILLDLTGQTFGRLTAIERIKPSNDRKYWWKCLCQCGKEVSIRTVSLRSGDTKSCGCYQSECSSKTHKKAPYYWIFTEFQRVNKYKNRLTTISFEDFVEFTKINNCHYCAAPITWIPHSSNNESKAYNLDRMDNSKGYSKDNCVVCCYRCNMVKRDSFTYEEMLKLGKTIQEIDNCR